MVTGRVIQVVVLCSNDCMGICLGGLSIGLLRRVVGCLIEVVVGTGLTVAQNITEVIQFIFLFVSF